MVSIYLVTGINMLIKTIITSIYMFMVIAIIADNHDLNNIERSGITDYNLNYIVLEVILYWKS